MIEFRTEIKLPECPVRMNYETGVLLMGSCFSSNIGSKLSERCFPVDENPYGILYNPSSIARGLERLLGDEPFRETELFFHGGRWNSFRHHGDFSHPEKDTALENINDRYNKARERLRSAKFLFVTFGTSWIYRTVSTGEVVSNCHKVPAGEFTRSRMTVDEIVREWEVLLKKIWAVNPDLQLVFTVSPIRHWKDGAHGNQLSKAVLLLAIENLRTLFPERTYYFPSYELVLDELRDYRFYAGDMLHMSEIAIDFIWEKFRKTIIDPTALPLMKKIEKLQRAAKHRSFNPSGAEYQRFLKKNINELERLMIEYPFVNLKTILEAFSKNVDKKFFD